MAAVAEENTKGPGKRNAAVEGHGATKAWKNDGVMVTAQVKLPVPTKIKISEKYQDVEGEVFVCLSRVVLTRQIDGSVVLSKAEAVGKVEG
jgi:hypothetical protein